MRNQRSVPDKWQLQNQANNNLNNAVYIKCIYIFKYIAKSKQPNKNKVQ